MLEAIKRTVGNPPAGYVAGYNEVRTATAGYFVPGFVPGLPKGVTRRRKSFLRRDFLRAVTVRLLSVQLFDTVDFEREVGRSAVEYAVQVRAVDREYL